MSGPRDRIITSIAATPDATDVDAQGMVGMPVTFIGHTVGTIVGASVDDRGISVTIDIVDAAFASSMGDDIKHVSIGPLYAREAAPLPKPERCPSCNAVIDVLTNNCRCFD